MAASSETPARKQSVPELTLRVVVLGVVLSVVMGAANVYLGLKVGMTVSASIPAAVLAMLVLRWMPTRGSILEANQVQTAASAGESLAAGIIFTMPALILIGAWTKFDFITTTLIAFTGGLLGILFMIPMRRVFVTGDEESELGFPEGVACAAVLEAGDANDGSGGQAMAVVLGTAVGAIFKLLIAFFETLKGSLEHAWVAGGRVFYIGSEISPALFAVGYIVKLNVAVLIFIGGALAWLICIPLLGIPPEMAQLEAADIAGSIWNGQIRYFGVGAMVVGGVASIWKVRGGLKRAIQEIRGQVAGKTVDDGQRDIPTKAIIGFSLLATLLVAGVYYSFTGAIGVTLLTTVIMLVMSFFFTAVASYIVGLVGNSNSPVSGMTITAVLFTGAMLLVFGFSGQEGMVATLGVAAIVCCAACTSGDVCNDLKTGQLVGASPWRQQVMQIVGVAVASVVMAPTLQLLHENTPGGIGGEELGAPQAGLFATLVQAFFGDGEIPWMLVGAGAVVGVIMLIIDSVLAARKSKFRAHVMPIAVGMYLPFGIAPPILLGGLLAHFYSRGASEKKAEKLLRRGVLLASGIIAGESLTGVGRALLASMGIESLGSSMPAFLHENGLLTGILAIAVMVLFAFVARPSQAAE